ncbi:hypothetical protein V6Z12_A09G141700 [Gossypium hirsutum]
MMMHHFSQYFFLSLRKAYFMYMLLCNQRFCAGLNLAACSDTQPKNRKRDIGKKELAWYNECGWLVQNKTPFQERFRKREAHMCISALPLWGIYIFPRKWPKRNGSCSV